jgi:hypothetical protein
MKNSNIFFLLLCLAFINCTNSKKELQPSPTEVESEIVEEAAEKTPEIPSKTEINKELYGETDLLFILDFIDKYPTQVDLFSNQKLLNRLNNIDRFNSQNLLDNWNTETPITIENGIIHSSGCKDNDCSNNAFELYIDLKNDNINIYNFKGNTLRIFKEKNFIELPKVYQDELEVKKANAKIGI